MAKAVSFGKTLGKEIVMTTKAVSVLARVRAAAGILIGHQAAEFLFTARGCLRKEIDTAKAQAARPYPGRRLLFKLGDRGRFIIAEFGPFREMHRKDDGQGLAGLTAVFGVVPSGDT